MTTGNGTSNHSAQDNSSQNGFGQADHSAQTALPARLLSGVLGASLLLLSVRRGGRTGLLFGTTGVLLLAGGVSGKGPRAVASAVRGLGKGSGEGISVEKGVTIGVPPEQLYSFWRNFENLPRFMSHLKSVTVQDGGRSHWVANAPAGSEVAWDAELTDDQPNRRVAWRSLEGATVPNEGFVEFKAAPAGRGSELRVSLKYSPPAGVIGAAVARLFGEEPRQQIEHDLHQLKRLLEVGAQPTTEGQSSGRKSAVTKGLAKMYDNRRTS